MTATGNLPAHIHSGPSSTRRTSSRVRTRVACMRAGGRAEVTSIWPLSVAETVKVPQMAESISEGTLKTWLKQPGDTVQADEEVATIETDKVCVAPFSPTVRMEGSLPNAICICTTSRHLMTQFATCRYCSCSLASFEERTHVCEVLRVHPHRNLASTSPHTWIFGDAISGRYSSRAVLLQGLKSIWYLARPACLLRRCHGRARTLPT